MSMLRLLHVLVLMIHQGRILLVEAQTTFNYPPFNDTNLLFGGDIQLTENAFFGTSEVDLNTGAKVNFNTAGTCASLLYGKPLQMRGSNSSFTTSFTFSIIGTHSAGFAFVFLQQNHTTETPGGKLCLMPQNLDGTSSQFLAVEFDTFQNPEFNDPSNNHVGVNINSMNSSVTYNLCGDGIDECTYLVYGISTLNIVHEFTSWIDYDSVTKSLAVYLTNGSTLQDIAKPTGAIIQASVDLSDVMKENMFVGFTGSTRDNIREYKRIMSWSFSTSARLTAPPPLGPINNGTSPPLAPINNGTSPPLAPINNGTSPPLAPINNGTSPGINGPPPRAPGSSPANIVPASSTGDSGSKSAKIGGTIGGIIGGIIVAIMVVLLVKFVISKRNKVRRQIHIFLAHAGGVNQEGKNFPVRLYDAMTSSKELKGSINVFIDTEDLPYGKPFPEYIIKELEKTEVGIVVLTPEFFTRKWPMTELITLIKRSRESDSAVIVLPLFYRMTVAETNTYLSSDKCIIDWEQSEFSEGKHPISPNVCHDAVGWMLNLRGIEYTSNNMGHDREYVAFIVEKIVEIVREKTRN